MIENIKKLCLGSPEDIRLAMILLAKEYTLQELKDLGDKRGILRDFPTSKLSHWNIVYFNNFCIFDSIHGCLMIADKYLNTDLYNPRNVNREDPWEIKF